MSTKKIDDALDDAPIVVPDDADPVVVEEAAPGPRKRGGLWVAPEGYVGREEALKIWCEMGKGRTLRRVEEHIAHLKRPGPSRHTLKKWSTQENWAEKATLYDTEVAMKADDLMKVEKAKKGARECLDLASEFRKTSGKIMKRLHARIDQIKIKSGGEAKAMAEAAVALNRAAEVLDGGVGDRTEHRETVSIEDRQNAAMVMVDDLFKQVRTQKGNDNKPNAGDVGDAPNARRSTGSV